MQPWEQEKHQTTNLKDKLNPKKVIKHIGKIIFFSGIIYISVIKHYVNLKKTK